MGRPQTHRPRLRILLGDVIAMGPGKADLLDAIIHHGSISAAARDMHMSYRRAWTLVDTMNRAFRHPLVEASTGGRGGGGAQVTECGRDMLQRYRAMEARAADILKPDLDAFGQCLRADRD